MLIYFKSFIKNTLGATVLELIATISTLAVISACAAPYYFDMVEKTEATVCLSERAVLERVGAVIQSENAYVKVLSIEEIVKQKYVDKMPNCPSGGTYFWLQENPIPTIGCTVHKPK